MIRCIKSGDTPALERMMNEAGFHRGKSFSQIWHGIPVVITFYIGDHGKRKNMQMIFSFGEYHFRFKQTGMEAFDGDDFEDHETNAIAAFRSDGERR